MLTNPEIRLLEKACIEPLPIPGKNDTSFLLFKQIQHEGFVQVIGERFEPTAKGRAFTDKQRPSEKSYDG